jgi:adenosine deaminase
MNVFSSSNLRVWAGLTSQRRSSSTEFAKEGPEFRQILLWLPFLLMVGSICGLAQDTNFARQFEGVKRDPKALYAFLKKMPKGGELHSHLSGAVPFERLLNIAIGQRFNVAFTRDDGYVCGFVPPSGSREWKNPCDTAKLENKKAEELSPGELIKLRDAVTLDLKDRERGEDSGFAEFNRIFDRLSALTDNADVMPDLVQEVMEEAAANKVSYLELKVNPISRRNLKGEEVTIEELVARLRRAVKEKNRRLGPDNTVVVNFIVGIRRQTPNEPGGVTGLRPIACSSGPRCPSRLRQAYFLAARRYSDVVVGVDLAGLPEVDSPADFAALMREFDEASITLHAGETLDPKRQNHIQEAILAGAKRVGHAFNLENSRGATALVCTRQTPLEISLTSNRLLGLLQGDDLKTHPFPRYFRAQICGEKRRLEIGHLPVTLNTDDAGIFQTDLTNEFFLAVTTFDLSWDEVKLLCRNSLTYAFATDSERQSLLERWEREMAKFESVSESPETFSRGINYLLGILRKFLSWILGGEIVRSFLGALFLVLIYAIFYLLYVIRHDRHYITIAPFRVWGGVQRSLPGEGIAARLREELTCLLNEMTSPLPQQPSGGPLSLGPGVLSPTETYVGLEYKGISLEALNTFLRRVSGRELVITGDLMSHSSGLLLVVRTTDNAPWETSVENSDSALGLALQRVAVRVLTTLTQKFQPKAADAFVLLQIKARELEEYDQAFRLAQLGMEAAPDTPTAKSNAKSNLATAHNDIGIRLAEQKKYKEAVSEFETAVELNPHFEGAYKNLAQAYEEFGEHEKAAEALRKVERTTSTQR